MTHSGPTGPAASRPEPFPLFHSTVFPTGVFNEAFDASAGPREHWRAVLAALSAMGRGPLDQRQERARRMRHEDGATYNPFDDPSGRGTPWALDMVPFPLTPGEWTGLETGLCQRAELLDRILADLYGEQNLLREGRIPPELVFANPGFLRSCQGIVPGSGRYLTYYAADLYRGADGRFRVFRDYGDSPAGLGYALENRIVVSRVFPDLYRRTQIQRLAPFFQAFHNGLVHRSVQGRGDPDVVLLSPGPDSRIYFEHALLSRYLGYPLVEGQDLTVRNGDVFLKKLDGLEPVEAIFRHIPDAAVDPFALRLETGAGVAGLIQAAREGRVAMVNPVGTGFVDTPALAGFLPDLCSHLLGQPLDLENHPAWWCGGEPGLARFLDNPQGRVVGPAMDRRAAMPSADDLVAAVKARPYDYVAAEPLLPAAVPAWDAREEGPCARYALLRLFVCATDRGYCAMPGGLAITAPDVETLTGDVFERQQSKDIWVLSDRPVVPFSLLGGLQRVPELRRGSDLPSRVADHFLWLGRYLERAEGLIRLLRSVYRRLSGEARPGDVPELPFLINLLRAENTIPQPADDDDALPSDETLVFQLSEAMYRQDRPESVVAILHRVHQAARNVRDRLSMDAWRVVNRLEGFADTPANDPLELLDDTLFTLSAFSGLAMEGMTRGLGWRFMDMGRRVERALNQVTLIRLGLPLVCADARSAMAALLEICDSIMTYRGRYRTTFQLAPVLDLLIVDESNPKSLAFQCRRLAAHVEHLPRQNERRFSTPEARMSLEMLTDVRLLDLAGTGCGDTGATEATVAAFLESMEAKLIAFAQQISAHYLSRVPATPHFSMIRGDVP